MLTLSIVITLILITLIVGGLALFLKNKRPLLKWGGLAAFGLGLLLFLLRFLLLPYR